MEEICITIMTQIRGLFASQFRQIKYLLHLHVREMASGNRCNCCAFWPFPRRAVSFRSTIYALSVN